MLLVAGSIHLHAQDTRAVLDISGRSNEISVAPDGRIWLVSAVGESYYTNSIDSGWHYGPNFRAEGESAMFDNPNLERVSFFNKDTAIITGYISSVSGRYEKDGFLRTTDGGKTWELHRFGNPQWIDDAFVNPRGFAWMGGSGGEIVHSRDFGLSWRKLNSLKKSGLNNSSRMAAIFMEDELNGIAAGSGNELFITTDNWSNYKSIATPLDQNKYKTSESNSGMDHRIDKVAVWNNQYVISQHNHVLWTRKDNIDWKPIPQGLRDFAVDGSDGLMYGIDQNSQVILIRPNGTIETSTTKLEGRYTDIKVSGGFLYVFDNVQAHRIGLNSHSISALFTTDRPIDTPELIRERKGIQWGVTRNHLYLSAGKTGNWYREAILPFYVRDMQMLNDSSAILWDGSNNYQYSLETHRLTDYVYKDPFGAFLQKPLLNIYIESSSTGCYHHRADIATYSFSQSGKAELKTFQQDNNLPRTRPPEVLITRDQISQILKQVNADPDFMPTWSDFAVTELDLDEFKKSIDVNDEDRIHLRSIYVPKSYLKNFDNYLDIISNETIKGLLTRKEAYTSTTSNQMDVLFVNEAGDELSFHFQYYVQYKPAGLPWIVTYKNRKFSCYYPALTRLVQSCMPATFRGRSILSNAQLIRELATYLYHANKQE